MSGLYQYASCGLNYVYLRNGYVLRQTNDGEEAEIHQSDALNNAIAEVIITRPFSLRGKEVRFLRSLLKLSQASLARVLQTARVTIARWEGAPDQPIKGTADTALRLLYALTIEKHRIAEQVCRILSSVHFATVEHAITFRETSHGWECEPGSQRRAAGSLSAGRRVGR
jgi:DNA-binding transcriptional regulator YiaG